MEKRMYAEANAIMKEESSKNCCYLRKCIDCRSSVINKYNKSASSLIFKRGEMGSITPPFLISNKASMVAPVFCFVLFLVFLFRLYFWRGLNWTPRLMLALVSAPKVGPAHAHHARLCKGSDNKESNGSFERQLKR